MNIKNFLSNTENKNNSVSSEYNAYRLKQITDLYSYIIKPEKSGGKLIFNKQFYGNHLLISLNALVWNLNNCKQYKKYTAKLVIENKDIRFINYKSLKYKLLEDIFKQVIKNNILMI